MTEKKINQMSDTEWLRLTSIFWLWEPVIALSNQVWVSSGTKVASVDSDKGVLVDLNKTESLGLGLAIANEVLKC